MRMSVQVDIDEDAVDDLEEGIADGLDKSGRILRRYGKKIAPVDTGTFRRSVDYKVIEVDGFQALLFGSSDVPGKVFALEDGHSSQAPQGVFEPSVRRQADRITEALETEIKKNISGL